MKIEFNQETWELERMPGYWILNKIPYVGYADTSISFYGNYSIEEVKKRLKKIENLGIQDDLIKGRPEN